MQIWIRIKLLISEKRGLLCKISWTQLYFWSNFPSYSSASSVFAGWGRISFQSSNKLAKKCVSVKERRLQMTELGQNSHSVSSALSHWHKNSRGRERWEHHPGNERWKTVSLLPERKKKKPTFSSWVTFLKFINFSFFYFFFLNFLKHLKVSTVSIFSRIKKNRKQSRQAPF